MRTTVNVMVALREANVTPQHCEAARRARGSHMSKPTPGPWRVHGFHIEARAFDGSWKYVSDRVRGGSPEAAEANARLIAAAPELLAVVIAYREACRNQNILLGSINGDADDVIAKATGTTEAATR